MSRESWSFQRHPFARCSTNATSGHFVSRPLGLVILRATCKIAPENWKKNLCNPAINSWVCSSLTVFTSRHTLWSQNKCNYRQEVGLILKTVRGLQTRSLAAKNISPQKNYFRAAQKIMRLVFVSSNNLNLKHFWLRVMSVFESIILFVILKRVWLEGLKFSLFLATNEVSLEGK
jgi:hypothetical protein